MGISSRNASRQETQRYPIDSAMVVRLTRRDDAPWHVLLEPLSTGPSTPGTASSSPVGSKPKLIRHCIGASRARADSPGRCWAKPEAVQCLTHRSESHAILVIYYTRYFTAHKALSRDLFGFDWLHWEGRGGRMSFDLDLEVSG